MSGLGGLLTACCTWRCVGDPVSVMLVTPRDAAMCDHRTACNQQWRAGLLISLQKLLHSPHLKHNFPPLEYSWSR